MENKKNYVEACINLFKAIPTDVESVAISNDDRRTCLEYSIYLNVQKMPSYAMELLMRAYGVSIRNLNSGLHSNFDVIKNGDQYVLMIEQLMHYITTYVQNGLDSTSIEEVDSSKIYVPAEEVNLPAGTNPLAITIVNEITPEDAITRVKKILASGIALKESTQLYMMEIIEQHKDYFTTLDGINNKEFKILMMDRLHIMPKTASDFLRYMLLKRVGNPMLIHSKNTLGMIKISQNSRYGNKTKYEDALVAFVEQNGIEPIAREFNRHRKIWIMLKHEGQKAATIINKARKLSNKLNKPARIGVLDRIGDLTISLDDIKKELNNVTIFKKATILNAITHNIVDPENNLYMIRNGRAFAKTTSKKPNIVKLQQRFNIVYNSLVEDIRPLVEGKKIKLSDEMDLAFPTSEKKAVCGIPAMSCLKLPDNAIVGIHWTNLMDGKREERVDLDLHYTSKQYHVGWNSSWGRGSDRKMIYHSGDLVNAPLPNGAAEAIYIPTNIDNDFAVIEMNKFTSNKAVPFELYVGNADGKEISKKYLISNKEFKLQLKNLVISDPAMTLGFLHSTPEGKYLYFIQTSIGNSIVSSYNEHMAIGLEAVKSMVASRLDLKSVLQSAGAIFEKKEDEEWDIDLSIDNLTSDSFSFLTAK